jgi:MYXO-CTERM domain-containing protein
MRKLLVCLGLGVGFGIALADTTPQALPLVQAWTNTELITTSDVWTGVPGIIGYTGAGLTTGTAVDPQSITADGSMTPVDVNANQTNTALSTGGVTEFAIPNPTIGIKGSGSAKAPHIVLAVNTTSYNQVRVRYTLRDLDGSASNSVQPIALQWRAGTASFLNVPEAFVPDATTGPNTNGPDIPIHVALPVDATQQPLVEVRIITTDAMGTDEYVGIDDIAVTDAASGAGAAVPPAVHAGDPIRIDVMVMPAVAPASTGHAVSCNIAAIGRSATQTLFDDGTNGDLTAGDGTFSFATTVGPTIPAGNKNSTCALTDAQGRTTFVGVMLTILPLCGDGRLEGAETCDDDGTTPGDGCSGTCTVEPGYTCTGAPSVCTDLNECTLGTDSCDDNATCTNTPGSFTCACNSGYSGDGMTCAPVCGDGIVLASEGCDDDDTDPGDGCSATCAIESGWTCTGEPSVCTDTDECAAGSDTCDDNATCTNAPAGSFTCACNSGYSGDGMTCASVCGDGIVVTGEACDDDDTDAGDGCSATCTIEPGYSCTGMPSVCTATMACGDGVIDSGEQCDDGDDNAGDGCNGSCEIEANYTCSGEPSTCIADRDGDGITNSSDNCPMVANPGQDDGDGDGVGDACEITNPDMGDGGGCCSSSSDNTGGIVLALGIGMLLRRRRRFAVPSRRCSVG